MGTSSIVGKQSQDDPYSRCDATIPQLEMLGGELHPFGRGTRLKTWRRRGIDGTNRHEYKKVLVKGASV
jgi:hypothetical protein